MIIHGDCLEVMDRLIAEGVVVDAIITDPPYGTTACKWDTVIPFDAMWERLNKLIKPNGAVVLFGSEPFSSALRMSNIKNYKYDWVWDKAKAANFPQVKYAPLKVHEMVSVFSKGSHLYYPQKIKGKERKKGGYSVKGDFAVIAGSPVVVNDTYYPKSILDYSLSDNKNSGLHPTQKPVALIEYLIRTYTNEGETVLDFTCGSGTTAIACLNTNRKYICIEKEQKYFDIASNRINEHVGKNKPIATEMHWDEIF